MNAPDDLPRQFEFDFEMADGTKPVLDWIKNDLTPTKRRALGIAMRRVLQVHGIGVCATEWGRNLKTDGICEFRLRMTGDQAISVEAELRGITTDEAHKRLALNPSEKILLRVMFYPYGDKLLLLLAGYDKGEDPSPKRQQAEIRLAQARLTAWKLARQRQRKQARRRK